MAKSIILGASALIALIYGENGGEFVKKYLPNAEISSINLAEVASYMVRQGLAIKEVISSLQDLSIPVVNFDQTHAFIAAQLIEKTSLSLGDRACLALGIQRNQTILTADKAWKELHLSIKIKFIR